MVPAPHEEWHLGSFSKWKKKPWLAIDAITVGASYFQGPGFLDILDAAIYSFQVKLKEVRKRLVCVFFGEGGWGIMVECLNIPHLLCGMIALEKNVGCASYNLEPEIFIEARAVSRSLKA